MADSLIVRGAREHNLKEVSLDLPRDALITFTGLLRWANAGHCTPFLVRADGRLQDLHTTGMPLGMLSPASYEVDELRLEPGDKIVAYSDGLSEAQNPEGRFFEAARMKEVIRAHALGLI